MAYKLQAELKHELIDAVAKANLLNPAGGGFKEIGVWASECAVNLDCLPILETAG